MQGLRTILIHNRGLAALLVALALFVRAAVPAGYMPDGAGRQIQVTLCADASGTPQTVAIPLDDSGKQAADHPAKHSACAFAGMAALDVPVAELAAPLPPQPAEPAPFAAQQIGVGQGLAAPPPYQTGPPQIA